MFFHFIVSAPHYRTPLAIDAAADMCNSCKYSADVVVVPLALHLILGIWRSEFENENENKYENENTGEFFC